MLYLYGSSQERLKGLWQIFEKEQQIIMVVWYLGAYDTVLTPHAPVFVCHA